MNGYKINFNKYLLGSLPPIGAISFFCIELAFSEHDLSIQQAFLAPTVLSILGVREVQQWNQYSREGKSDGVEICFHVCFCPTFTPPFLIITMGFPLGRILPYSRMQFWGIHLILWFPANTSNPGLPIRPRLRTFIATLGKEMQLFQWDCRTGRILAWSYDDPLHWELMCENEDNIEKQS